MQRKNDDDSKGMCLELKGAQRYSSPSVHSTSRPISSPSDSSRPRFVLPRGLFTGFLVPADSLCLPFFFDAQGLSGRIQQVLLVLFSTAHGIVPALHGREECKVDKASLVFGSRTSNLRSNGVGPPGVGRNADVDGADRFLAPLVGGSSDARPGDGEVRLGSLQRTLAIMMATCAETAPLLANSSGSTPTR